MALSRFRVIVSTQVKPWFLPEALLPGSGEG